MKCSPCFLFESIQISRTCHFFRATALSFGSVCNLWLRLTSRLLDDLRQVILAHTKGFSILPWLNNCTGGRRRHSPGLISNGLSATYVIVPQAICKGTGEELLGLSKKRIHPGFFSWSIWEKPGILSINPISTQYSYLPIPLLLARFDLWCDIYWPGRLEIRPLKLPHRIKPLLKLLQRAA